jgi:hypothetical protein
MAQPNVKLCLDWTERRNHIAGPFAVAIMNQAFDNHWLEQITGSRALRITKTGFSAFERILGIPKDAIEKTSQTSTFFS